MIIIVYLLFNKNLANFRRDFSAKQIFDDKVFAYSQFNGGLIECLDEPRHVGVITAWSLTTITLLSIPPEGISVEQQDFLPDSQ